MESGLLHFPSYQREYIVFRWNLRQRLLYVQLPNFCRGIRGQFDLVEWMLFDYHTESVYEAEVDKLYDK